MACVVLFTGCAKEETASFSVSNVPVGLEGPLFEGANTAQGDVADALAAILKEKGITAEQISSARLTGLNLTVPDSVNFNMYTGITVQLVSDKTDMIKVGVINPVPKDQRSIDLSVAGEQDKMLDLLKQNKFTVVTDVNVAADTSMDVNIQANLKFEIIYKK